MSCFYLFLSFYGFEARLMYSETTSKVEGLHVHTQAPLWNFLYNTSDQIRPKAQEQCLAESHCIYRCSQIVWSIKAYMLCILEKQEN